LCSFRSRNWWKI